MKIIINNIIPFKGFSAINICGVVFARHELSAKTLRHEAIHTAQIKEMFYIFFYLWYLIEYVIKLIFCKGNAYRSISFEREAYKHEHELDYKRKKFSWIKYL